MSYSFKVYINYNYFNTNAETPKNLFYNNQSEGVSALLMKRFTIIEVWKQISKETNTSLILHFNDSRNKINKER